MFHLSSMHFSQMRPAKQYLVSEAANYAENKQLFDDVSCQKCQHLSLPLFQCAKCSKVYCKYCFDSNTLFEKNTCPNCKSSKQTLIDNVKVLTLQQILFPCQYKSLGCQSTLNIEKLPEHEDVCPFKSQFDMEEVKRALKKTEAAYSSNTLKTNMSFSPAGQQYCATTESQADKLIESQLIGSQEYVPMSVFKSTVGELTKEIKVLTAICSANFRGFCNNGHPLLYEPRESAVTQNVICDVCKREPTAQFTGSYRCATCDFDRCEQCYQARRLF